MPAKKVTKKYFRIFFVSLSAFAGIGIFGIALLYILVNSGTYGPVPGKEVLKNIKNPLATQIYTADSILIGKFFIQDRNDIDSSELTPILVHALVATEDARFFEHSGIDVRSLFRVFFKTILFRQRSSGGGSTLSQQLAKNLFPRSNRNLFALPASKIREMIIARRLEKNYSKEEILLIYLNTVPFGENTFGIKSASLRFFNRIPSELKAEEVAVLIGMLKATTFYNPRINPEESRSRRNTVLSQMVRYGYMEEHIKDSLANLDIILDYHPLAYNEGIAPYFREFIRRELKGVISGNRKENGDTYDIYTDGLKVYTTIDSRMQKYAEEAVIKQMRSLQDQFDQHWKNFSVWKGKEKVLEQYALQVAGSRNAYERRMSEGKKEVEVFSWDGKTRRNITFIDSLKHQLGYLQAGFLVMDNRNARIKAWVGGIDFNFFKYDHVLSARQAGSAFKPFVYLAALENGMKPCDLFPADSVVYEEFENWTPRNADQEYQGYYTLKGALAQSVNTVSVNILMETGLDKVMETISRAGFQGEIPAVPSIALGTAEVSLLDMVSAYQGIANGGVRYEPEYILSVEDADGKLLFASRGPGYGESMCDAFNAGLITGMLRNAVTNGTGSSLISQFGIKGDIAGKTGTTQNHSDGWFIGFTPEYTAGAWVGGELPHIAFRSLAYGQGAHTALPVWAYFFSSIYSDREFSSLQYQSFNLEPEVLLELACDDYYDTRPFRIFNQDPVKVIRELFRKWKRKRPPV